MARLLRIPFRLPRVSGPPASTFCRRVYSSTGAAPPADAASPPTKADPSPTISPNSTAPLNTHPELPVDSNERPATDTQSPAVLGPEEPFTRTEGQPQTRGINPRQESKVEYKDDKYTVTRTSRGLLIEEFGKKPITITDITLRDACKCPVCVDPHSKQRNFRTSDIPTTIKSSELKVARGKMRVLWKNEFMEGHPDSGHYSTYDLYRLRYPILKPTEAEAAGKLRWRALWDKGRMDYWQHWITFDDFMNNDIAFAWSMRTLAELGLIFVKDIPDSREMVEKIATRMGPIRNTFYGPTWDVRSVPNAKNVAYTNQFLGFHMDLMYMNDPPGYQLLHCLQNSCEGGESLFVDTFRVAYNMKKEDSGHYNYLSKAKLHYEYNHDDHFYTNNWPVFELSRSKRPTERGDIEHFPLSHVNYSPPFQAPFKAQNLSSHKVLKFSKALKTFADGLEDEKNMFELKMKPGECVIFENRRVAHARRAFKTDVGQRWLAGTYVDEDAMLSLFKTSANKYPNLWKYQRRGLKSRHVKLLKGAIPTENL
ncbi:hypothetical protein ASPCADRAFT_209871 [Aspergillus carbonarius ITEM 5010]|uniref:TauD/TfdA-like domain-containing protein n=1 Tax=Aspergillus carbonarius (strain ITEM 5010) TaxID=602072 RepID=A0A1R3RDN9_ASPC5|nr:hypothetical protein ASPCADRAFT_151873 [Aspergillus carbonarius ITEM 5010]OOF92617.1 hypothetical protein ASPCADRAFT_209871 [Aspergillus carbonarius ITEM 5010]